MKKKTLICLIAILCVITCALCVILTACNTDNNNEIDQKIDFSAITENDWKGEKLTEEQWKKAFDSSNFDNVSIYQGYKYDGLWYDALTVYLELNAKRVEQQALPDGMNHPKQKYRFYVENDKVNYYASIIDEKKTTDRNHIEYLWVQDTMDSMDVEELENIKNHWSYTNLKDKFSDFEYKDGAYFAENLKIESERDEYNYKISFKDGKVSLLSMLSEDSETMFAYRNYGKTSVSLPKDSEVIEIKDVPKVMTCEHVDNNNNDFCDKCWRYPMCKEHIDDDKDGICDWCYDCTGHIDEDKDGTCDACDDCIHVDEDKSGRCDKCDDCLGHMDEDKDGICDICKDCMKHIDEDNDNYCDKCHDDLF